MAQVQRLQACAGMHVYGRKKDCARQAGTLACAGMHGCGGDKGEQKCQGKTNTGQPEWLLYADAYSVRVDTTTKGGKQLDPSECRQETHKDGWTITVISLPQLCLSKENIWGPLGGIQAV